MKWLTGSRGFGQGLTVVGVALAAAATLTPAPEAAEAVARTPWWCLRCGTAGAADLAQNLLLFVPVTVGLAVAGAGALLSIAIIAVFSTAVELLQHAAIAGRDASLGDVLANTAGGALGWMLARRGPGWWRGRRHVGAALLVTVGCAGALLAAPAMLFVPAPHLVAITRARIAPQVQNRPRLGGAVLAFAVNGTSLADRDTRVLLHPDSVAIDTRFTWAGPTDGTATIARIDGSTGDAVISVDQRGTMIRAHVHTRANGLGLRSPVIAVEAPAHVRFGDTVLTRLEWRQHVVRMRVRTATDSAEGSGRFGPLDGWRLFSPFAQTLDLDDRAWLLNAAWGGCWLGLLLVLSRRWRALRSPEGPPADVTRS